MAENINEKSNLTDEDLGLNEKDAINIFCHIPSLLYSIISTN